MSIRYRASLPFLRTQRHPNATFERENRQRVALHSSLGNPIFDSQPCIFHDCQSPFWPNGAYFLNVIFRYTFVITILMRPIVEWPP